MWVAVAGLGIPWLLRITIEYGPEPPAALEAIFGAAWPVATFVTFAWMIATRAARDDPRDSRPPDVVAAAIIVDGRLLLAQRSRPAELAGRWELPGGRVESGETHAAALVREIREELGAEVEPLGAVGSPVALPGGLTLHAYLARLRSGTPTALEHLDVRWFSADELRLFDTAEIVPADRDWIPDLCAVLDGTRVGDAG